MATNMNVLGATLTRRQFVKAGGALFVGVSLAGRELFETTAQAATAKTLARRVARHRRGSRFTPTTPS